MNILFLGPENKDFFNFLRKDGHTVLQTEKKVSFTDLENTDFIISYGYRHLISREIVNRFAYKAINLHISYLPWNRGADPNLWSFLKDTPKGVSIHYIDHKVDTGDVIVQERLDYVADDTLRTTYAKLKSGIENLFYNNWDKIKANEMRAKRQEIESGSYHRSCEKDKYADLLTDGWDTRVMNLLGKAL